MRKIILALLLMTASQYACADMGLFLDDTGRFLKTGVIQTSFPNVSFKFCRRYKACDKYLPSHKYISIVFSDFNKMRAEAKRRAKSIETIEYIGVSTGPSYKIVVYEIVDDVGNELLLLGVKSPKKITKSKNMAIAQAIVDEINEGYARFNSTNPQ
jgi:hypothetical protein